MEEDNLERITANNYTSISQGKYIGGGVTSILVGFGVGHAVQGRYKQKGWMFTVGEGLALGGYIALVLRGASSALTDLSEATESESEAVPEISGKTKSSFGIASALLLVYSGLRIWEMVDAWMLPSDYKVVQEPALQLKPLVSLAKDSSLNLGLSLKYQF